MNTILGSWYPWILFPLLAGRRADWRELGKVFKDGDFWVSTLWRETEGAAEDTKLSFLSVGHSGELMVFVFVTITKLYLSQSLNWICHNILMVTVTVTLVLITWHIGWNAAKGFVFPLTLGVSKLKTLPRAACYFLYCYNRTAGYRSLWRLHGKHYRDEYDGTY